MKIRITFDVSERDRDAIAYFFGVDKPADYNMTREFIEYEVQATLEGMITEEEVSR